MVVLVRLERFVAIRFRRFLWIVERVVRRGFGFFRGSLLYWFWRFRKLEGMRLELGCYSVMIKGVFSYELEFVMEVKGSCIGA